MAASSNQGQILLHVAPWCPDCKQAKNLKEQRVPYEWLDFDQNQVAQPIVLDHNAANKLYPGLKYYSFRVSEGLQIFSTWNFEL